MALTRDQKESVVAKITDILDNSKSVVFLNFTGLDVGKTTDMRSKLGDNAVSYMVAKKTLAKIAIDQSNVEVAGDLPELSGELAIAYTNGDETAAAREIYEFQKEYEDNISIQAGVFEGKLLAQSEMMEIAQIPGMYELRGMFVNLINSPIQRLAIVMNEIAKVRT
jgi:large subunit ribosomal protein L10